MNQEPSSNTGFSAKVQPSVLNEKQFQNQPNWGAEVQRSQFKLNGEEFASGFLGYSQHQGQQHSLMQLPLVPQNFMPQGAVPQLRGPGQQTALSNNLVSTFCRLYPTAQPAVNSNRVGSAEIMDGQPREVVNTIATTSGGEVVDGGNNKARKRALQFQVASRNYRERKKMYQKDLESESKGLKDELASVKTELLEQKTKLERAMAENEHLRQLSRAPCSSGPKDFFEIAKSLQKALEDNAEEWIFTSILAKLDVLYSSSASEELLRRLVDPCFLMYFVLHQKDDNEATTSTPLSTALNLIDDGPLDEGWTALLSLTQDQKEDFKKIIEAFKQKLSTVLNARQGLLRDIAPFFVRNYRAQLSFQINSRQNLDLAKLMSVVSKLDELKKNMGEEVEQNRILTQSLSKVLSPRQLATVMVKLKDSISELCLVVATWNAMGDAKPSDAGPSRSASFSS